MKYVFFACDPDLGPNCLHRISTDDNSRCSTYMQTVCKDYQHKLLLRKQSDLGPRCLSMRMREATVCTQARFSNVSSVPLIIPSSICHAGSKRNNCMYAGKISEREFCPFD